MKWLPSVTLSPLLSRRIKAFSGHKRGLYSLWILLFVVIMALGAEFICNDSPYVVRVKGEWYFPLFKSYPENLFGGSLEIEADFKDPLLVQHVKEAGGWMIWPPVRFGGYSVNRERTAPAPPSSDNWWGTDDQGRDVFARFIYGLRTSLIFGFLLTLLSLTLGIFFGAVQGYFGGLCDLLGQRFQELWSSLPVLFILIVLSSFVQPNLWWLLGIMLLFSWMGLASLVRAEFLRARNHDYVKAAHILGLPSARVMWRHMLPNAMIATLTYLPFLLNHSITVLTSLDFLGFGLPLGTPSLGELLTQAKNNLYAPWLGITAFGGIAFVLILVAFIGEALRDATDAHTVV